MTKAATKLNKIMMTKVKKVTPIKREKILTKMKWKSYKKCIEKTILALKDLKMILDYKIQITLIINLHLLKKPEDMLLNKIWKEALMETLFKIRGLLLKVRLAKVNKTIPEIKALIENTLKKVSRLKDLNMRKLYLSFLNFLIKDLS